jgi:hypothetical protein
MQNTSSIGNLIHTPYNTRELFHSASRFGRHYFYRLKEGLKMKAFKRKPCPKCPYKLGLVETVANPCPQCELDGYSSYEWFQKMVLQGRTAPADQK